jgi:hypothetical protein
MIDMPVDIMATLDHTHLYDLHQRPQCVPKTLATEDLLPSFKEYEVELIVITMAVVLLSSV